MPTNADLVIRTLRQAGITRCFGIPSGNTLPLLEAMRVHGMEYVLTAHEGSAGFAADVTGRVTGRPGFCLATHGPGATNLATGVGCAFLDRSPMLALTCNIPTTQLGRRVQMHIDHHAFFAPITKATLALRPGKVAATIAEAVRLALSEPAGPVHLDLPEDVAVAPTNEALLPVSDPSRAPPPAGDAIAQAIRCLGAARRPLAVIGASAMRVAEPQRLRKFLERHRIPFMTTAMAKGLVDDDHPLALGCIERARRQLQRDFVRRADLIVGLGYDPIEVEYEAWIGSVPLLHIDIAPADTDGSVRIAHQLVGNLDHALRAISEAAPADTDWQDADLARHRRDFQVSLRPSAAAFTPHQAIDAVRRRLPQDGVLAFDVGAHTHQIASQWPAHAPRTFLVTNGWSSMGFGIPAAIAAKLAEPDRAVVALIGDGCFQMTCGEVAVAKRLRLALPIVVLNDRWLGLIKVKQERRQLPHFGTALDDWTTPAHYFGVPAVAAVSSAELEHALETALAAHGPTVIEAIVDPAHYSETVYD